MSNVLAKSEEIDFTLHGGYKENFNTLQRAAQNNDLCLLSCKDIATGKMVAVICAYFKDKEGQFQFVPLGKMFDGNPYEEVIPSIDLRGTENELQAGIYIQKPV